MKSNKFIIVAIAAIIPAAAAFAQTSLADAVRNGEIATGEAGVPMRAEPMPASSISRVQIARELSQAQASNTVGHGETGTAVDATQFASTRTRAEVQAEAVQAVRNGDLVAGEAGTNPVGHSHTTSAFAQRGGVTTNAAY